MEEALNTLQICPEEMCIHDNKIIGVVAIFLNNRVSANPSYYVLRHFIEQYLGSKSVPTALHVTFYFFSI